MADNDKNRQGMSGSDSQQGRENSAQGGGNQAQNRGDNRERGQGQNEDSR